MHLNSNVQPLTGLRAIFAGALFLAAVLVMPSAVRAQCGTAPQTSDCNPPPSPIFDLAASEPSGTVVSSLTTFTTSFVGDGSTEFVSFAFRETPAYWLFDNASVTAQGSSTNLLSNSNFALDTVTGTSTGPLTFGGFNEVPVDWGHWIQPVDVSAIGVVASTAESYGCGDELSGITGNFYCDGSVEGYDAIYQAIPTTAGTTYTVTWQLVDNSDEALTVPDPAFSNLGSQIDMLVYAGDNIPLGSTSIAPPPGGPPTTTPEPSSILLLGLGVAALFLASAKKRFAGVSIS